VLLGSGVAVGMGILVCVLVGCGLSVGRVVLVACGLSVGRVVLVGWPGAGVLMAAIGALVGVSVVAVLRGTLPRIAMTMHTPIRPKQPMPSVCVLECFLGVGVDIFTSPFCSLLPLCRNE